MKVLIISHNEICYNPRLLKAADFFSAKGWNVTVFNPVTGIASAEVYEKTISGKAWKVIANEIHKRSFRARLNWVIVSLLNKFYRFCWDRFRLTIGFDYCLNKGLIGAQSKLNERFDYILIHLVDSLPFAVKLKNKWQATLIYDSQEYFVGQYAKYDRNLLDWVKRAEKNNIGFTDLVITTSNAMKERLIADYNLKMPVISVRNAPSHSQLGGNASDSFIKKPNTLYLVWHGMTIFFNNGRGVHVLLKAISHCKTPVNLYLQGILYPDQRLLFDNYCKAYQLEGKVFVIPPADPLVIVASLKHYDVGLSGELNDEDNQLLTNSNKLFDYINAGLAVILPDLPGLTETTDRFNVGLIYHSGNSIELAEKIDWMNTHRSELKEFQHNSTKAAIEELYWEFDYEKVWTELTKV